MRFFFVACGTLLFSAFVMLAGSGLLFGLIPLRADAEGFSDTAIGVLGSFYFAGMLIGCLGAPLLIRSVGHIRVYAACAAAATAMPLGLAMFPEPVAWALMRMITGCCFAVIYAIIESWLNERASNEIRGVVLAVYNIINYAALAGGQQMLRLYEVQGFELFAVTAILISVAAIPVALTRTTAPTPPETASLRPLWLFHLSPVAFVGAFSVGLANGAFWSLTPVYITSFGFGATGTADFATAVILGCVLTLFPLGRLSDQVDRRVIITVLAGISAAVGLLLALSSWAGLDGYWFILGMGAIYGAVAMPIYAITGAHGNDHAKPSELVEVATGLLLIYTFGAVIGPLVASQMLQMIGPGALFAWTAGVHAVLMAYAAWRMTRRAPVIEEYREPFAPTPRTSTVAVELSPLLYEDEGGTDGAERDDMDDPSAADRDRAAQHAGGGAGDITAQ